MSINYHNHAVKAKVNMFKQTPRFVLMALLLLDMPTGQAQTQLRVCADPDNLPYSNRQQQGFENKIAAVIAKALHAKLSYTWQRQRTGFIRQTLSAERCDVVMGVPYGYDRVLSTQPYYVSSYVFVTQKNRHLTINSFDDPILRELKIGLHGIGNDGSNSPPASALAVRGLNQNLVGFSLWADASVKNPQSQLIDAVAQGDIDVAIVWGPIAGYYAQKYGDDLELQLTPHDALLPDMPFYYEMALGVRKQDQAFASQLEKIMAEHKTTIDGILTAYNIPLIQPLKGTDLSDLNTSSNPTNR